MRSPSITRRQVLAGSAAALAAATLGTPAARAAEKKAAPKSGSPFPLALNAATIRGYKLPIDEQVDLTAKTGYDAMEPWVRDIQDYQEKGGSLPDLRKRIADAGLTVESGIAFSQWIVDDEAKRTAAIEQLKREMDVLSQIGGKRIAAPPSGATREPGLDLNAAAERYRTILELGEQIGVIPQIEVWGFSQNLHRLGESMYVVIESGHPRACLLPDFYHIYKGGSSFEGLRHVSPETVQVFHMNDYPDIPRDRINDSDRVLPGEGVAPLPRLIRMLADNGVRPVYSLEIFNSSYWQKYDAPTLARMGFEKMKSVVEQAMA